MLCSHIKMILILVPITQFTGDVSAQNTCSDGTCNYEAICEIKNGGPYCACIGDKYFSGKYCSNQIDNCSPNPCNGNARCTNALGQPICGPCQNGIGGHLCDVGKSDLFTKLYVHHNRYGYMASNQQFLFTLESLGSVPFLLEFHTENYAIDVFKTNPKNQLRWKKSDNLAKIARQLGLHHADKLPYNSGYYYVKSGVFWKSGIQTLQIKVTDLESQQSYMDNTFTMNILPENLCHPEIELTHCADPFNPLMIDVTRYFVIAATVRFRCLPNSKLEYDWDVYNTIETVLLYSYKRTRMPRLKVHSYASWTRYLGELMQSFMIRITITETLGEYQTKSVSRCYIFILTKPVIARIVGGAEREVSVTEPILLNGSPSRDLAVAAVASQRLSYSWTCKSTDDPDNPICTSLQDKGKATVIPAGKLKNAMIYKFSLEVSSNINTYSRDKFTQSIKMVTTSPLFVDITCVKNCETRRFVPKRLLHLLAACYNCEYHTTLSYTWTVNGVKISNEKRLIIKEASDDDILKTEVEISYRTRKGKAKLTLFKNSPPTEGKCEATPSSGDEIKTEFRIVCSDFNDNDQPIIYEYAAEDFILDRTTEKSTTVYLPKDHQITVNVCDPFDACITVPVAVDVKEISTNNNVKEFLSTGNRNLSQLFKDGAIERAMTVAISAANIVTIDDASFLQKEMVQFRLKTLLDIEQYMCVMMVLIKKITPLKNEEARIVSESLRILSRGLQNIIEDGEVRALTLKTFTSIHDNLAFVLDTVAEETDEKQVVQTFRPFNVHVLNRMEERYPIFDFNKNIIPTLFNWVLCSTALDKCIRLLGMMSAYVYKPEEPVTSSTGTSLRIDTLSFESRSDQIIKTPDGIAEIVMSSSMIFDLQAVLNTPSVVLQRVSSPKNPFWWYPDLHTVNTGVLYLSGYSTKIIGYTLEGFKLADALELKLKLNMTDPKENTENHLLGCIESNMDMNIFKFYVPKNALLTISFVSTKIDLEVLLELNKRPTGFRTHRSNIFIKKNDPSKKLLLLNAEETGSTAYLGVVPAENVNESHAEFALVPELRECLSWSFSADDPQWTTDDCWPEVTADLTNGLHCYCKHMSIYAGRTYPTRGYALHGVGNLLTALPLNWFMLGSQMFLGVLIITWVFVAYLCLRQSRERLITTPKDQENFAEYVSDGEIIIRFTTGGYRNASTTAGIILILNTIHGQLKFKIYQNPKYPQLKQHSTCTVRLPVNPELLIRPISIYLKQDGGGRYPSWYCRCLEINYKDIERPVYINVNSWVDESGMQLSEIIDHKIKHYKRSKQFADHLETICTNWFFYNPLFGPWKYGNMTCNRFERTLIWMLKAGLSLVIISLAYGWTTLRNYEEERYEYMFVSLDLPFTMMMSLICFSVGSIVQLGIQFWIFKSSQESETAD